MRYCDRCNKESRTFICSMYNTQMICSDCKQKETELPDYKEACQREHDEVCKGNYNYEGIGYPK